MMTAVCVLLAAVAGQPDQQVELGFFYVVHGYAGNWNSQAHWPWVETEFDKDLAVLASLGVKTVKIGFAPPLSMGVTFRENAGAEIRREEIDLSLSVMREVLRKCALHGIRPIVAFFLNDYYLRGPNGFYPNNKPNWYEWSFAHWGEEEGGERLAEVLCEWEKSLVVGIEALPGSENILYYNVFSELSYIFADYAPSVTSRIFRRLLEEVPVPGGKLGADAFPFFEKNGPLMLADLKAAGKDLDWTEVHLYPPGQEELGESFSQVRKLLPDTRVILGEFGLGVSQWGDGHARGFADFLDEAARHGAGMALNWGLWDYNARDTGPSTRYGLSYALNDPRDALGVVVQRYSALPNGDFEQEGHAWSLSEGQNGTLVRAEGAAATGTGFLRFETPAGRGLYFVQSPVFPVSGGRLALNAYLRASAPVSVRVMWHDGEGWSDATGRYAPQRHTDRISPDRWTALQDAWEGRLFNLPPGVFEARLEFIVAALANEESPGGHFLEIDTLSVQSFDEIAVRPRP